MSIKLSIQCFAFALTILASGTALAGSHTGIITRYALDGRFSDRGVCIQMTPELPIKDNWICLWKNHSLYMEITNLLLEGFTSRKKCMLTWSSNDNNGRPIIEIVDCSL